jgi:hypothetical protein
MLAFDMDVEIERYVEDQLKHVAEIMMKGGAGDFDSYNQYVGLARAYVDVREHIHDLRKRRAEGDDEEDSDA